MKYRETSLAIGLLLGILSLPNLVWTAGENGGTTAEREVNFTGELLPVFYVTNVLESVEFYRQAGFEFHHFFDYSAGKRVQEWSHEEPPIWAEMAAGPQTFGLHRIAEGETLMVGGMRHYFLVEDVETHYKRVRESGVDVGELIDKPWMKMFAVTDPDGHEIYFGTEK